MITDMEVIRHLSDCGRLNDTLLAYEIEQILNEEPVLTEVPKPIKLISVKNINVCGLEKEFEILYNQTYAQGDQADIGYIEAGNIHKTCDYEIWVIMKSLVLFGMSKDEERSEVCKNIFLSILQRYHQHITKSDVFMNVLTPNGNYIHDTICNTIVKLAYKESEAVHYGIARILNDKPDALRFALDSGIDTFADLKQTVDTLYQEAKASGRKVRGIAHDRVALEYAYDTK